MGGRLGRVTSFTVTKYTLTALFVAVLASGLGFASAQAQTEEGLEGIAMSPTSNKVTLDAGSSKKDSFKIINNGSTAYDFIVYPRPYSVSDVTYDPNFSTDRGNTDAYRWVQFETTRYHLEPGKSATVNYTINVPSMATPGGHYGVIFAETQPAKTDVGSAVIRRKRVGLIIYASVSGKLIQQGEAQAAEIPFWQTKPPLQARVLAKNSGNVHFTDEVSLTVRDIFGQEKFRVTREFTVMPQTTRKMNLDYDDAQWFGLYNVDTEQKFLGKSVRASSYVLMMPNFIPVIVVTILVIGGGYAWFRRSRR